jgi:hypothetical protein
MLLYLRDAKRLSTTALRYVRATEGDVVCAISKSLAPVGSTHSWLGVRATRNRTASQVGHRITAPMFCP